VRSRVPALLAFAAAILLATVAGILVLEGVLLAQGRAPITWYTQCAIAAYPMAAVVIGLAISAGVGALLAHFYWLARKRSGP
jgi:hypothetical protein